LFFYSVFRIIVEKFRQPDEQVGFLFLHLTMGQVLSFAMFLIGCVWLSRVLFLNKK
jgi:phosphatidylglycerol:prolipoprotein diacylglycerol transferase